MSKYVYMFDEPCTDRDLLGSKGAGLAIMTQAHLPVPYGFTITTQATKLTDEVWEQVLIALLKLESLSGKKLGETLLVSVRSGAKDSMPGMLDTILNVGLTGSNAHLFPFLDLGIETKNTPLGQLKTAITNVFNSWQGERVIEYRKQHNIPDTPGTAVTIQAMVFGNLDVQSGTGVVFTRNPSTGEKVLYGEYLPQAQGVDLVSGYRTPQKLGTLSESMLDKLAELCTQLELLQQDMQDIEFTIESNKLWLLQTRNGKRTDIAANKIMQDLATEGIIDASSIRLNDIKPVQRFITKREPSAIGIPASPGLIVGRVCFNARDVMSAKREYSNTPIILVRPHTKPSDINGMLASDGVLTAEGGATSHAAIVMRQFNKPCVVGTSDIDTYVDHVFIGSERIVNGDYISMDGTTGKVYIGKVEIQ